MKKCILMVLLFPALAVAANFFGHPYWDGPPPGESYYSSMDAQLVGDSLYVLYAERESTEGNFIGVWARWAKNEEWIFDHKILQGEFAFPHTGNLKEGAGVVSDSDNNRVLIVTRSGVVLWDSSGKITLNYPNDAELSADGKRILISEWAGWLKEIDLKTSKIVWEYQAPGENFHDADYIPGGGVQYVNSHTGEVGEVVQIDRAGVTVWSHHPALLEGWIRNAERLENGVILIADNRMIVAVTKSHKEKILFDLGDCGLYNIHVTAEGLLYAAGSGCVGLIAPDGKSILWEVKLPRENPAPVLDLQDYIKAKAMGYIQ